MKMTESELSEFNEMLNSERLGMVACELDRLLPFVAERMDLTSAIEKIDALRDASKLLQYVSRIMEDEEKEEDSEEKEDGDAAKPDSELHTFSSLADVFSFIEKRVRSKGKGLGGGIIVGLGKGGCGDPNCVVCGGEPPQETPTEKGN